MIGNCPAEKSEKRCSICLMPDKSKNSYESYIATQLKKMFAGTGYNLSAQDKTYHLFDEPKKFLMKPDIVIRHKETKKIFVMDTKWKVLADSKANYGISQADMYQMYAYQNKYGSENVNG